MTVNNTPLWDLPTRVCHWLFVILIAFSWWTAEYDHLDWHTRSGYTLLALVIFRIVWGFVGSRSSRFIYFLRGPKVVVAYFRQLLKPDSPPSAGHNPMGGWSVVILLSAMLLQILLGLFSEDVDGLASGPLSYWVSYDIGRWAAETHEVFFNVLIALIVIHLVFVLFYVFYKKDNLILPMITGLKNGVDTANLRIAPLWLALTLIAASSVFVWWLVT
jgi:cytochrome b